MKRLLTTLVLLAGATGLLAVVPNPKAVQVGMSFTVTYSPGSGAAQLDVPGEPGGSVGMSLPGTIGQSAESYHASTWLKPGKVYTASFMTNAAGPAPYNMGFTAPDGYAVYVNNIRADQYYIYTNPPWYGYYWGIYNAYFTVQVLPLTGAPVLPAGSFSGISVGQAVSWEVGLGQIRNGGSAGVISFREGDLTGSPVSRARLAYWQVANNSQNTAVYDGTGLRQVMTPQALADLVNDGGGNGYWIKFYTPSQGSWNGSTYTIGGSPWRTIRVESPGTNQMKITETEGTVSRVSLLALTSGTVSTGTYQWTMQEGDTSAWLRTTTHDSTKYSGPPVTRYDIVAIRTGGTGGTIVAKTCYVYTTKPWGEEVTQMIADPDSASLVTTYDYHDTSTDYGNYGKVKSMTDPTGNWTSYAYYNDWNRRGQLQYESHPWMDSPGTAQTAAYTIGNSISLDYSADFSGRYTIPTSRQNYVTTAGTVQTGKQLSTATLNQTINSLTYTRVQVNAYASSSTSQTSTVETLDPKGTNPDYYNQPVSIKRPDQTQDSFVQHFGSYSSGTFTIPGDGSHMRTIVFHGSTNSSGADSLTSYGSRAVQTTYMVPNKSTAEVSIRNPAGLVVRTESWIYTGSGSFATVSYTDLTYDSAGRLTASVPSNGAEVDYGYLNGRLDYTNGVDNAQTKFTYDALGRVHEIIKKEYSVAGYALPGDITTTNTYDGADHITQQLVSGGSLSITSTAAFDKAGRQTQSVQYSTSANNSITTGTSYSSGGRIVTVTLPSGSTNITESYLDGQLKQVSGTGVVQQNASYSVDSGTGNTVASTYAGNVPSSAVTTTADWLGRKIKVEKPVWSGTATYNWYFNTSGQIWKQTQPGAAPTLYIYDTLGQLKQEGLDVDSDGALVPASTDRITEHGWTYYFDGTNRWLENTTSTYPQEGAGAATAKQTGKTWTLLTLPGTVLNFRYSWDIFGNQTSNYQILNRSAHLVSTITDVPDSPNNAEQSTYNGYTVRSVDTANVAMKFGFDDLGRQCQSIDPRTGTTTTAFIANTNLVNTVTDPTSTVQATYAYDSSGRVKWVKDAAGKYAYTAYTDRGEVRLKWGQTTYPVEYGYDSSGRQTTMKTYATSTADFTTPTWPTSPNNAQTTTWNYQAASGLLSSKVDNAGKSVDFTYTTAGQLYERKWARILSGTTHVTTTYSYSSTTGELTGIDYNDSTPDVTYAYNRIGALASVEDYTGTGANKRSFTYNLSGTLELQREDFPTFYGTSPAPRRLTYEYDTTTTGALGRPTKFKVGNTTNAAADQEVTYTYQSDGRLLGVSPGASYGTFSYSYQGNSDLVSQIQNTTLNWTQTRSYLAARDLINEVNTQVVRSGNNVSIAKFDYDPSDNGTGYDALGRRTVVNRTGEMFNSYGNGSQGLKGSYDYNDRSELKSEVTYLGGTSTVLTGRNDSLYDYDLLGNRKKVTHNGTDFTYASNNLNQYSSRSVSVTRSFDVSGATSSSTVTITSPQPPASTSQPSVTRHGDYFFQGRLFDGAGAVFTNITVDDGTSSAVLPSYVSPSTQAFTYDDDGNLKGDGRWAYTYDAENRLIWMETHSTAIAAGVPKVAYHIFYDYMGRRVLKHPYIWNGTGWSTNGAQERYLYNGWNLVARLENMSLNKNYFWGMDIAGPGQRAGGICGLLMIKDGSNNYVPGYDAQGNLHALIKASDGSLAACYEYDAYGQTIRESGTYAASNPFRYATKFTDDDTGLVYYGKRYYSPSLGRFINRDPIEESGGVNLHGFCANNAVNFWDYLGYFDGTRGRGDCLFGEQGNTGQSSGGQSGDFTGWLLSGLAVAINSDFDISSGGSSISQRLAGAALRSGAARDVTKLAEAQKKLDAGQTVTLKDSNGNTVTFEGGTTLVFTGDGAVGGISSPSMGALFAESSSQRQSFTASDGRVLHPNVKFGEFIYPEDDVLSPIAPYEEWDGVMQYKTPLPAYRVPTAPTAYDGWRAIVGSFEEKSGVFRDWANIGNAVGIAVPSIAAAPFVGAAVVELGAAGVVAAGDAANYATFRIGMTLIASGGASLDGGNLVMRGVHAATTAAYRAVYSSSIAAERAREFAKQAVAAAGSSGHP